LASTILLDAYGLPDTLSTDQWYIASIPWYVSFAVYDIVLTVAGTLLYAGADMMAEWEGQTKVSDFEEQIDTMDMLVWCTHPLSPFVTRSVESFNSAKKEGQQEEGRVRMSALSQ